MFALQTIISSPLKLMVNSSLTMEEMCVITIDFLAKLDMATQENLTVNIEVRVMKMFALDDSLRLQVQEGDTSAVRSMRHLACVPTGKNDGLLRLQRVSFS